MAYYEFIISDKVVIHKRSVYNLLDLIGDVGGLFDGLKYIAKLILGIFGFIWNQPISYYLLKHIYTFKSSITERAE